MHTLLYFNIVHKLIFEFHSITHQYVPGEHVNHKVIVNEDANNGVNLFVGDGKSFWQSFQMVNNDEDVLVFWHGDIQVCD